MFSCDFIVKRDILKLSYHVSLRIQKHDSKAKKIYSHKENQHLEILACIYLYIENFQELKFLFLLQPPRYTHYTAALALWRVMNVCKDSFTIPHVCMFCKADPLE